MLVGLGLPILLSQDACKANYYAAMSLFIATTLHRSLCEFVSVANSHGDAGGYLC